MILLYFINNKKTNGMQQSTSTTPSATDSSLETKGTINCGLGVDCNYVGDVHIITDSGNIELIVGCEDEDCE